MQIDIMDVCFSILKLMSSFSLKYMTPRTLSQCWVSEASLVTSHDSDKCWADCSTLPEVHEPFTRCKPPLRVTEGPSKSPQAWLPSFVDLGPDFNGAIVRNLVLSTT